MSNHALYHKVLKQLDKWLPQERITRKRNMALLIIGLQTSGEIHLSKIVRTWPLIAKLPSMVNRLNRFLSNLKISPWLWYRPLAKELLLAFSKQDLRLIMDCTKVGFHHRLLSISIAYKKRSLPLVWRVYQGSKGHVSVDEQINLLRLIMPLVVSNKVYVLADAGFDSVYLMQWLSRQHWHFVMRQNGRSKVSFQDQDWIKLKHLPISEGETKSLGWVRLTEKHQAGYFWLVMHWAKGEDEAWYLLTNFSSTATKLIRLYKVRMWTEEMYGDMKGHGFNLEDTHLNDKHRISRLFLAVALTFVWLICLGSWLVKRGFRHFIDVKSRRDKSYFRLGWDWLLHSARLNLDPPLRFSPLF